MTRRDGAASRGQALVEFAIVAPVFFLLLFGLIDLGRYVYVTNSFAQAAREAGRYASVWKGVGASGCPTGVGTQTLFNCVTQETKNRLAGAPAYYNVTSACETRTVVGRRIVVPPRRRHWITISTPTSPANQRFQFFTPFIGQLLGNPTVSATTKVVRQ